MISFFFDFTFSGNGFNTKKKGDDRKIIPFVCRGTRMLTLAVSMVTSRLFIHYSKF